MSTHTVTQTHTHARAILLPLSFDQFSITFQVSLAAVTYASERYFLSEAKSDRYWDCWESLSVLSVSVSRRLWRRAHVASTFINSLATISCNRFNYFVYFAALI